MTMSPTRTAGSPSLEHTGAPFERMSTQISYTEVSDEDYLRQLSSTRLEVHDPSSCLKRAKSPTGSATAGSSARKAQQYRLLDRALAEPYKILPRLEVNRPFSGTPFAVDYSLTSEFTVFEHKDPAELTGQRSTWNHRSPSRCSGRRPSCDPRWATRRSATTGRKSHAAG